MTETGHPGGLDPESASETTGASLPAALPTRRSLRAQRESEASAVESSTPETPASESPSSESSRPEPEDAPETTAPESVTDLAIRPVVVPSVAAQPTTPVPDAGASVPPTHYAARRVTTPAPRAIAAPKPPVASAKPKQSRKRSLGVIAALFVVPGVFLTVSLPAYAFSPASTETAFAESGTHKIAEADAQSVDVSISAAKITVSRDGYTAVSGEEIRRATAEAAKAARAQAAAEASAKAGSYSTPGQRQEGDDYPWPSGPVGVLSPLNYEYRECVDFVAWRLNRDAGATGPWRWVWSNLTPGGGSAWNWANAWYANGWQVSHDPIVGSVAWFTGNHVAYVQSVNGDGTVTIEEYNQNSDHNYHRRTIPVGGAALYLYPPPA